MASFASLGDRARRLALPSGKVLGGILLAAFALRVAAACYWQWRLPVDQPFAFPDSYSYWELGRTIAAGEPYQFGTPDARVFRTPGYPLLLAGLFRVASAGVSPLAVRILGAVLGTTTVAGVYLLARRLFDTRVGLCAAALAAVYPGAIAISILVLSEALFVPLMVLHLALWVIAWQTPRRTRAWAWSSAAGLAAAAATLARPSWLLFVPAAVVAGLAFSSLRARHLELGGLVLAGLAVGMLPWWIRNARATGHFVPTTLQVGASLYDGLNPHANGASEMSFVPEFERLERAVPAADAAGFEYRLDRRLRDSAWTWARQHPGRVVELAGIKFARMWNVWPNEQDFRAWPLRLLIAVTYLPVLLLGLWGTWRYGRCWPDALCWLPAVYLTLLHVIFVSSLRYREPAMVPLLVLAAAAICRTQRGPMSESRTA